MQCGNQRKFEIANVYFILYNIIYYNIVWLTAYGIWLALDYVVINTKELPDKGKINFYHRN